MTQVLIFLCLTFSVLNIILAINYFRKTKMVWRWIKLLQAIACTFAFIVIFTESMSVRSDWPIQLLVLTSILSVDFANLVVSNLKIKMLEAYLNKLDETMKEI